MPVCGLVRGVPRLIQAKWSLVGTTAHTLRRSQGPATLVRSRTYGPLYHRRQRCLVPASGYYIDARDDALRRTLYLHARDGALLAFAALWNYDGSAREVKDTVFTLVSCGRSHEVHVPLVLWPEQYDAWLNDEDPRHLLAQRADRLLAVTEIRRDPRGARPEPFQPASVVGTLRA